MELEPEIWHDFGICLCCGKHFGLSVAFHPTYIYVQFVCQGEIVGEQCANANRKDKTCDDPICRLTKSNVDYQAQSKKVFDFIISYLERGKEIIFPMHNSIVIRLLFDLLLESQKKREIFLFSSNEPHLDFFDRILTIKPQKKVKKGLDFFY